MSPLLVVLNNHLSSSHPFSFFALPFCFHCVLPQPIHLTASCPISLSSSFFSPPSILGYLFTASLCHNCLHWSDVAGKCAFQRDRSGQETGDVWLVLFPFARRQRGKAPLKFQRLKGVLWRDDKRGMCWGREGPQGNWQQQQDSGLGLFRYRDLLGSHWHLTCVRI